LALVGDGCRSDILVTNEWVFTFFCMIDARTRRFQAYNVRDDEKNKTYNSDNTKNNTLLTYRWLHEKQAHTERVRKCTHLSYSQAYNMRTFK